MSNLKQHGINISLSTIGALIPVLTFLWFFIQPALVDAVAQDLDEMIEAKQAPVQTAFKTLLRSEISKLRIQIARLETHLNDEDWTEDDAKLLAELRIELEAIEEAYSEL